MNNFNTSLEQSWTNKDNNLFYDNNPIDFLPNVAIKGGLDACCDLVAIKSQLLNAHSILEIGAGYGRVIDYLLMNNFKGKITAVERDPQFCQQLKKKFGKTIFLIQKDISEVQFSEKFDLILWMWTGIWEFSKNEQLHILKKLSSSLSNPGLIVIDTLPHDTTPKNAIEKNNQYYVIQGEAQQKLFMYAPSNKEIEEYARKIDLTFFSHLIYETAVGRTRTLHLLGNSR